MTLLVTSEILGPLFNTWTANNNSSLHNNENFWKSVQMQVSKKQNIFYQFFCCICEVYIKF